jgi:hypothetical protein
MKRASRCASHRQKAPHAAQLTRFACGPALLPMMPTLLPQLGHGCGSWIRKPMMGEVGGGADDGGDEDSKKSNCGMYVTSFDGTSFARCPRWGYVRLAREWT